MPTSRSCRNPRCCRSRTAPAPTESIPGEIAHGEACRDPGIHEAGAFREAWHERFGNRPVTGAELLSVLERNDPARYLDQTLLGFVPGRVLEAIAAGAGGPEPGQLPGTGRSNGEMPVSLVSQDESGSTRSHLHSSCNRPGLDPDSSRLT